MPKPKSYAERLIKGSAIVFTASVAAGIIGFLLRMFLARSLSVYEYGLFFAVFAFISLFTLFRDPGLVPALVKFIPEFAVKKRFRKIKSSIVLVLLFEAIFAFSVAVILFIFSDQIALAVFKTADASLVIKILSIWFFAGIFTPLFQGAFLGFQEISAYASIGFFRISSVLLLALLLVGALGFAVEGVASAYLLTALAMGVFGFALFKRRHPRVFAENVLISKPLIRKMFAFGLPIFIGGFGGLIIGYTDILTITIFRSLPEVGFYQVAQPAARILWFFTIALTAVLFPMISELWARREKRLLGHALHFLTKFSFILIIPGALVFIAFPDIIIRLLFGTNYLAGTTALQILGVAAIIYTLYRILVTVMIGIGKPIINTKTVALMACFNLVGNLLLVPRYGIEGAAVATLFSYLIGLVLLFHFARKFIKFTLPSLSLFKAMLGGALTLLLILALKSIIVLPPWPEAFAVLIPSLLFYGIWILATKAITKDDLRLIRGIVPMPEWLVKVARRFVR